MGQDDYGILVVETDGTITKNDTLKSADGADQFAERWSVHDDLAELVGSPFFQEYHQSQRPKAAACLACPDLLICGGGMPTHRWSAAAAFDNPSVFCADQKRLIDHMREQIALRTAA